WRRCAPASPRTAGRSRWGTAGWAAQMRARAPAAAARTWLQAGSSARAKTVVGRRWRTSCGVLFAGELDEGVGQAGAQDLQVLQCRIGLKQAADHRLGGSGHDLQAVALTTDRADLRPCCDPRSPHGGNAADAALGH